MMKTVAAVAMARKNASPVCSPSARNVSSGPYADDDRPSAPSPTHASSATSESLWNASGSLMSLGGPKRKRRMRLGMSRGGPPVGQAMPGHSAQREPTERLLKKV